MHIHECQGLILHWFYSPVSASLRESSSSSSRLLALKEIYRQKSGSVFSIPPFLTSSLLKFPGFELHGELISQSVREEWMRSKSLTCLTQQHHLATSFWDLPSHRCWGFVTPSSTGLCSWNYCQGGCKCALKGWERGQLCQTRRSPLTTQIRPAPGSNFRITSFDNSSFKNNTFLLLGPGQVSPIVPPALGGTSQFILRAAGVQGISEYCRITDQGEVRPLSTEPEMPNAN